MFLFLKSLPKFRFSKSYDFSEHSKKGIKDFLKTIHPDLFEKAPSKVKEENERSLKLLNNYMDCLKKNQGSTSVPLKFYAANKDNNKSKKFLYFEVELPGFMANSPDDVLQLHQINAVKKLTMSLYSTKLKHNPFAEDLTKPGNSNEVTNIDTVFPDLLVKSSSKLEAIKEITDLKHKFNKSIFESTSQLMKEELIKSMKIMYPAMRAVEPISSEILSQLETQKLHDSMEKANVDLKVFFIDKNLPQLKILEYFYALVYELNSNDLFRSRYYQIQKFLIENDQKLKILVSNKNAIHPSFVSIDCSKAVVESMEYVAQGSVEALDSRENIFNRSNSISEFKNKIESEYGLKIIYLDSAFMTDDVETSVHKKQLFLKKLVRVFANIYKSDLKNFLENLRVNLIEKGIKVSDDKLEWDLAWNFDDKKLFKLLRST